MYYTNHEGGISMRIIPEDIRGDVEKIASMLISYNNDKKLSWLKAYKDVLKELRLDNKSDDDRLLTNVVTELTNRGYDIIAEPFKLEPFR